MPPILLIINFLIKKKHYEKSICNWVVGSWI